MFAAGSRCISRSGSGGRSTLNFPQRWRDRRTDGHAAMGFWRQTPREARKKMGVANHEVSVDLIQLPERFKPLTKIQIGGEARKWILCMSSVQITLTMARIVDRMTLTFPSRTIPFNFKSATASAQKLWRLPKIQVLNLSSHVRGDDFGAEEFP